MVIKLQDNFFIYLEVLDKTSALIRNWQNIAFFSFSSCFYYFHSCWHFKSIPLCGNIFFLPLMTNKLRKHYSIFLIENTINKSIHTSIESNWEKSEIVTIQRCFQISFKKVDGFSTVAYYKNYTQDENNDRYFIFSNLSRSYDFGHL